MPWEKSYFISLSENGEDRLRVHVWTEKGQVRGFAVQHEAHSRGKWRPVVRYDTAHPFAHKDILHPDGSQDKQPVYFPSFNIALSFAIKDLRTIWRWYRSAYEQEMKR